MRGELLEAERVHSIVAAFFTVYNYFGGGGLCEAAYSGALECELTLRGHKVDREVMAAVYYKGKLVARQRLDMVVDDRVIVESKATERLLPSAGPQLISYLRATTFEVGVLLHFGPHPKFYRFVDSVTKLDTNPDRIRADSRDSRPKTLGPAERDEAVLAAGAWLESYRDANGANGSESNRGRSRCKPAKWTEIER
ncbi:MAG TPA: GxxExxY protein [Gemmatimonadaceae bacterium]